MDVTLTHTTMPFHPLSLPVLLAVALVTTQCIVQASPTAESSSWSIFPLSHTDRIIAGISITVGVILIVIASYFCCCHKACRAARGRRRAEGKMQPHQAAENGNGVSGDHRRDASVPPQVQRASINKGDNVASDARSTTTDAPPSYEES
ncbi:hypothetical protein DFH06DRAFT_1243847 [Mycena polygramma]|nr:hypothetical protein DFH06DRAFT_1243847 [Mycena polygramma]